MTPEQAIRHQWIVEGLPTPLVTPQPPETARSRRYRFERNEQLIDIA